MIPAVSYGTAGAKRTRRACLSVEQIRKLKLGRGDVLVLTLADPDGVDSLTDEAWDDLVELARETGAYIIALPPGSTVATLDEETMNAAGWFRK